MPAWVTKALATLDDYIHKQDWENEHATRNLVRWLTRRALSARPTGGTRP